MYGIFIKIWKYIRVLVEIFRKCFLVMIKILGLIKESIEKFYYLKVKKNV